MKSILLKLDDGLLAEIDHQRGLVPRQPWLREVIKMHLLRGAQSVDAPYDESLGHHGPTTRDRR